MLLKSFAACLVHSGHEVFVVINGSRSNSFIRLIYTLRIVLEYFLDYNVLKMFFRTWKVFFWPTWLFCEKLNIRYKYVSKKSFNSLEFFGFIQKAKPDYGFSLGWPFKFSEDFINLFKSIINYHNGLLPYYKGVYSTHWSIYNNEKSTGYSFHFVSRDIDAGAVLFSGNSHFR